MAQDFELIVRGGTVVDGTGSEACTADVAVATAASPRSGTVEGQAPAGRSTPTACSSRPGFVDIHTHYDGQATWDAAARAVVAGTASPPW